MRMNTYLKMAILSSCVLLAGCSFMSPVSVEPMKSYRLTQINPNTLHATPSNMTLLVSIPTTAPGYESSMMAYVEQPYQITYFTKNRWVSAPAGMLAPLLVQSLQNTGRFKAVIAAPYAGFSDVRLDVVVIDFYQDFTQKPSRERVTLLAQLVDLHTHRVIAKTRMAEVVLAASEDPYGGVVAANQAVAQALGQLAQFVVKNTAHMQATKQTVPAQITALKAERGNEASRAEG